MSAHVPVCRDCDGDGWVHVWSQDGETIVANIDCVVCGGSGVLVVYPLLKAASDADDRMADDEARRVCAHHLHSTPCGNLSGRKR